MSDRLYFVHMRTRPHRDRKEAFATSLIETPLLRGRIRYYLNYEKERESSQHA